MSDEEMDLGSDTGSDRDNAPFTDAVELPEGIRKEVVTAAEMANWRKPKKGDSVTVHYVGTLESDGTEFDSSRKRDAPVTFTLGVGEVIKGWDLGIPTMRKGEVAKFTLQPEFAYGAAGSPPHIPENAVLVFEVEVISWIAKDDLFRDGGVTKSQLQEGSGWKHPKKGQECRVCLKIADKDGELLQAERVGFDYIIASGVFGPYSKIIDKALGSMNCGEKVSLAITEGYVQLEDNSSGPEATIELTLEEVYEVVDVSFSKDKSLMKKITHEGQEYDTPKDGVQACMRIDEVTDGTTPLLGFQGPAVLDFVVGAGEIPDALEAVAVAMKRSERCLLTCSCPEKCRDARLGTTEVEASRIVLAIEMLSFEKGPEMYNLGNESKMLAALDKKDAGGELFRSKRFELALEKYKKVIELINQTDKLPPELAGGAADIKRTAELNKAACFLQLGNPTAALSSCNTVLKEDRFNVKALFRRAKAHLERNEATQALSDLDRVLELDPDNREARSLIPHAKRAQKVHDKESRGMFNKMCDGFGKLGAGKETKKRTTAAELAPAPSPPVDRENVVVTFQIDKKLEKDETIHIMGDSESLGSWDVERAVRMSRKSTGPDWERIAAGKPQRETWLWETVVNIPQTDGRVEYRYVVRHPSGDCIEDGQKHAVQLTSMGGNRVRCNDEWRSAMFPQ